MPSLGSRAPPRRPRLRASEESAQISAQGVALEDGTRATMSDNDDDHQLDYPLDIGIDGHDTTGFGPLIPTEFERTLMERVMHELKIELKQGFRSKIEDVREEIMRKRRAGKLPGDTISVLKVLNNGGNNILSDPTPRKTAKLVEETGLKLKQINNWFINQRKRNWHSHSKSPTTLKSKRKR